MLEASIPVFISQGKDLCENIGARLYEPKSSAEVMTVFPQLQPELTREGGTTNSLVTLK